MNLFEKMLSLQLMLFCLISFGILTKKAGIIHSPGRKALSDLLINVILPCNIINSFTGSTIAPDGFIKNSLLIMLLSAGILIITIYGSKLLFRQYPRERRSVLSYGMICSNSSFVGLPITEALFGNIGVMYTSIFQIPVRFAMWTAGLALFTETDRKNAFRKLIQHPCIISVFIGILLMAFSFQLPNFLSDTIASVSKCTIPISMFVIGTILADAPIQSLFSKTVLYYTALRLVLFPALVYLLLLPLELDPILIDICLLMSGMPAAATTSILADKYGHDAIFASQITFVSTLFSIITIPLIALTL